MKFILPLAFITLFGCSPTNQGTEQHILLNDIWVLESLDGKKIDKNDFPNGFPSLEFNDSTKTVTGFTGCNRLSGSYEINNSEIIFSPLATTKVFCQGVRENDFLDALTSINNYKIENLKLYLSNNKKVKLIFKKVD